MGRRHEETSCRLGGDWLQTLAYIERAALSPPAAAF